MRNVHLFVYGTLLPQARGSLGEPQRALLARQADFLGPALMLGLMFDLGGYPGLANGQGSVHGGVYRLETPEVTFPWLDAYEGVTGADGDEYRRCEHVVTLTGGTNLTAWVYVYSGAVDGLPRIPSGDWLGYGG